MDREHGSGIACTGRNGIHRGGRRHRQRDAHRDDIVGRAITDGGPVHGGVAAASSPSPSATGSFVVPPHANYVGEVMGNLGSIAIVVHDTSAVAYFCNGGAIEAWMSGVPDHGKLALTGKNHASGEVNYALGHARGSVMVDGNRFTFSVIAVHAPSGLYRSIAVVRGATVKAGWIVLANGMQVGSLEGDPNAAAPTARKAPALNLTTRTANDGGVTITAAPIDAETGSGF